MSLNFECLAHLVCELIYLPQCTGWIISEAWSGDQVLQTPDTSLKLNNAGCLRNDATGT